ncbi:hypothetical protein D6D28_08415 [Aureobasidium pullulans]|uniref:Uncharacterized protein n=1 Tax=Aureobasidium pullulans TaxID=5580 RepID=A0A4S8S7Z1_AURPU|nr:hypothetical protein D6D28_08415 [Aureobasidium pullulans]
MKITEGASTAGRAKPLASVEVAKDLVYFLWACDEYSLKHPRIRVQLSFAMLLMMYEGLRPGEFTECSSRRGKNEGFMYRDFSLQRQPLPNNKEIWVLAVSIRNRKNHRNIEKDAVVHILTQEPDMPHLCPVAHFCALALADGAFQTVASVDDLRRVKRGCEVKIKNDMKDVPLLRRLEKDGQISPHQVFTADSLGHYLRGLGQRAGYLDPLTPYAFRRGHANKLDQAVSSAQRRQRMGHVSDDTMQYYISSTSGVDTQSIMHDREPLQNLIDHLRSMANRHDPEAPIANGYRLTDPRRSRGSHLSSVEDSPLQPQATGNKRPFDIRRAQLKASLHRRRKEHCEKKNELHEFEEELESDPKEDVPTKPADLENPYAIHRTGPTTYLLSQLRYEPARASFIQFLSSSSKPTLAEAIAPLQALADPTPAPVHYPNAFPDEHNACTRCDRSLRKAGSKPKANRHLLACLKSNLANQGEEEMLNSSAIKDLTACKWSCCSHSFKTSKLTGISEHLDGHVSKSQGAKCWWEECQVHAGDQSALEAHLLQQHGLPCASTLPTKVHYCYECSVWERTRASWESHCDVHLSCLHSMGPFCGQIVRHGLIVVAAKCVFCLGQLESSPDERFHQFADCFALHSHISNKHLTHVVDWPMECPHPYCSHSTSCEDDFWLHLTRHHGIEPRNDRSKHTECTESLEPELVSNVDSIETSTSEDDSVNDLPCDSSKNTQATVEMSGVIPRSSVSVQADMDHAHQNGETLLSARRGQKVSEVTQALLPKFKVRSNVRCSFTPLNRASNEQSGGTAKTFPEVEVKIVQASTFDSSDYMDST